MEFTHRIAKVRAGMVEQGLDAFVTLSAVNYFYLTGFNGSSGAVIITADKVLLMTDSRYMTQSKNQVGANDVEIYIHKQPLLLELKEQLENLGLAKIGYETGRLLVAQMQAISSDAYTLEDTVSFVERIREIKDADEIAAMRKAIAVVETVFTEMLTYVKVGMTEVEVSMRMEMHMRQLGASGPSFDTIFASGVRGALPHGAASDKVIEAGDFITVDFGAVVDGYCSDMTRTFAMAGPHDEELVKIYNIVLEAQLAGTAAIAPGKICKDVDAVARKVIEDAGYGPKFGHSLGHAVGIEVHELPGLSVLSNRVLEPGMMLTTEPGIYIEGLGGVRIEDMVLVTANGFENMMSLPKELIIV